MLLKLNRIMRKMVLVLGAVCLVFKLLDKKTSRPVSQREGFQTEEFDDIW
ncbi:MAG: hypothetical protein Q4F78_04865 [Bacillota bacterium]|nr:hypothetical protein [Bacillota bacterium]